jgi:hypothetical protein
VIQHDIALAVNMNKVMQRVSVHTELHDGDGCVKGSWILSAAGK